MIFKGVYVVILLIVFHFFLCPPAPRRHAAGAHSCDTFISLCLWFMVFSLVLLALSVGTSSLTHFLLPKWFETFLTSTDVALNKMKSFLPKDHVIPLLNPSNKPCCFRAVWLSKPINCFLFSFTCSGHAGLSLGTELYLGAPETKLSALPFLPRLFLPLSSPNPPLPQWIFKFHSFFQI